MRHEEDMITAQRKGDTKQFSKSAWDYMVQTGSTYGWEAVIEVPAEVKALQDVKESDVADHVWVNDQLVAVPEVDEEPVAEEVVPAPLKTKASNGTTKK